MEPIRRARVFIRSRSDDFIWNAKAEKDQNTCGCFKYGRHECEKEKRIALINQTSYTVTILGVRKMTADARITGNLPEMGMKLQHIGTLWSFILARYIFPPHVKRFLKYNGVFSTT